MTPFPALHIFFTKNRCVWEIINTALSFVKVDIFFPIVAHDKLCFNDVFRHINF